MSPLLLAKNQFAARVWRSDALIARQLIDHYEGNLILNRLELVTLALECLQKRETTQYFRGDHSYALMGLLRIRPKSTERIVRSKRSLGELSSHVFDIL